MPFPEASQYPVGTVSHHMRTAQLPALLSKGRHDAINLTRLSLTWIGTPTPINSVNLGRARNGRRSDQPQKMMSQISDAIIFHFKLGRV